MERTWLIRTQSNDIIGPVKRDKLVALLNSKKLSESDELSSGNGYWFFIRETELVSKYLYQGVLQTFNPVQEAESLFVEVQEEPVSNDEGEVSHASEGEAALPSSGDLDYPEINDLAHSEPEEIEESKESTVAISSVDIQKKLGLREVQSENKDIKNETHRKRQAHKKIKKKTSEKPNQLNLLLSLATVLVALVLLFFIFRKNILGSIVSRLSPLPSANAQELFLSQKKK